MRSILQRLHLYTVRFLCLPPNLIIIIKNGTNIELSIMINNFVNKTFVLISTLSFFKHIRRITHKMIFFLL